MDAKSARAMRPKNKAPAPIQITAEQLLREASERLETLPKPVKRRITDGEEASELRQLKRKGFEDKIRRNRGSISNWLAYASYEESLLEFPRVRSIYERALEIDSRNITLWLKYAEFEMRHKNVNMARNVWNRAVTQLPFVEQFWYKFALMEELLGNVEGARAIFERWLTWDPQDAAYLSYIKLEVRYEEYARARIIYAKLVNAFPSVKNYLKWARFESSDVGDNSAARQVYEIAIDKLHEIDDIMSDEPSKQASRLEAKLFKTFAAFESHLGEYERARAIYKLGMKLLPNEKAAVLEKQYLSFERQYGDSISSQELLINKRRNDYERILKENPYAYDTWFDFLQFEEQTLAASESATPPMDDIERIRCAYERAVATVPPLQEKPAWARYVYLWIAYALFEELASSDKDRARAVYKRLLDVIPHRLFTFAKVWDLYCKFLVRMGDLQGARKLLGRGLGMCPKPKLFKAYLSLESKLKEFERIRTIFIKWILYYVDHGTATSSAVVWIDFAMMEAALGETARARAIFELALDQPHLASNPKLWQKFIEFEESEGENDRVEKLKEAFSCITQSFEEDEFAYGLDMDEEFMHEDDEQQHVTSHHLSDREFEDQQQEENAPYDDE